jgi:F0F1-type ATP synthase membrane subunit b/b'
LGQALTELGKEVEQAKSELRQAAQGLADKAANQILDA